MSFILVLVEYPDRHENMARAAWESFHAHANLDSLKEVAGVFYINETAWIFDTRKTLPEYGLVIHQANHFRIQLFSFQLHSEALLSRVVSSPPSDKLAKFLSS